MGGMRMNRKKIIFFILYFTIFAFWASAQMEESAQTAVPVAPKEPTPGEEKPQQPPSNNGSFPIQIVISIFTGSLAGVVVSIYYQRKRQGGERRSLILAFCVEFISTFERCVLYYKQKQKDLVSFSSLFDFTDSSILSKYASVCTRPKTIQSIVELKESFYQIRRHVEMASEFALKILEKPEGFEQEVLKKNASKAQSIALIFFRDHFDKILRNIDLLIETAKKEAPGVFTNDLSERFQKAKKAIPN
jgi:hypothetical protein